MNHSFRLSTESPGRRWRRAIPLAVVANLTVWMALASVMARYSLSFPNNIEIRRVIIGHGRTTQVKSVSARHSARRRFELHRQLQRKAPTQSTLNAAPTLSARPNMSTPPVRVAATTPNFQLRDSTKSMPPSPPLAKPTASVTESDVEPSSLPRSNATVEVPDNAPFAALPTGDEPDLTTSDDSSSATANGQSDTKTDSSGPQNERGGIASPQTEGDTPNGQPTNPGLALIAPTPTPIPEPTIAPTATPKPSPTATATPRPTPFPQPTATARPQPTSTPQATATPKPRPTANTRPVGPTREALVTREVQPVITEELAAKADRRSVLVRFSIGADGGFEVALRGSSGNSEIDNTVLAAARRWRWKAALRNGEAVSSSARIRFSIR